MGAPAQQSIRKPILIGVASSIVASIIWSVLLALVDELGQLDALQVVGYVVLPALWIGLAVLLVLFLRERSAREKAMFQWMQWVEQTQQDQYDTINTLQDAVTAITAARPIPLTPVVKEALKAWSQRQAKTELD